MRNPHETHKTHVGLNLLSDKVFETVTRAKMVKIPSPPPPEPVPEPTPPPVEEEETVVVEYNYQEIFFEDFDGTLTSFGTTIDSNQNVTITADGTQNSDGLLVDYVGYDRGSERVLVKETIPTMAAGSLSFDVKFDANFDFVIGGKLHGLGPEHPLTGGTHVNPMRDDGWSTRFQFREGGALGVYTYHQDIPGTYGQSFIVPNFTFERERWYNLEMVVIVNSSGNIADGRIDVFIDDNHRLTQENVRLRGETMDASLINTFLFSTFHGGSSPSSAPVDENGNYITVNASFDNFLVRRVVD